MLYLTDRYNIRFPVRQFCGDDCYNVILNSLPLSLADCRDEIDRTGISGLRLMFTVEDGETAKKICRCFSDLFLTGGPCEKGIALPGEPFTRGHFKRGVE